ncbi:GYD domain-containing protein [Bradyrhizobium septentrionale]|uniref:GYD domain-containing protein n=1 Tax=Bradyrhizobium septentrionale TaxID=1404411 RepID=UPI001CD24E94|nr:GYD domain-containing protein [Bradyrhizobium septentrionale]UGY25909.1 GYD domain-containing protein [Bradyrhizobium septentrionale]
MAIGRPHLLISVRNLLLPGSRPGETLFSFQPNGAIAMHFCFSGEYTPRALNNIMENPTTNRYEAARKLIEAAGGKLISMYSTAVDGPGVMVIFDVPDPSVAPAISGVVVAAGTMQNVKLTRLFTQDEIKGVRQHASKLKAAYTPLGG